MLVKLYECDRPAQDRFYSFANTFYNVTYDWLILLSQHFPQLSLVYFETRTTMVRCGSQFDEFSMAKVTVVEKLFEWNAKNVAVFKVLKEKNLTITVLPKIIEFILYFQAQMHP